MTTFLLIRHGHTDWIGKALAGHLPGIGLNEAGRDQARDLVRRLSGTKLHAIYSSPLQRARETAEPLSTERNMAVVPRPRAIEIHFGDWTGRTISDLETDPGWKRFNTQRSVMRIPNGELMLDVQARMVDELEDLRLAHRDETVAVFSHQDTIKAAIAHYLGMSLDHFLRFQIDPASVSVLQTADWGARVITVNNTGALT